MVSLILGGWGTSVLRAGTSISANEVIRRAVARTQQHASARDLPDYTYRKITLRDELDGSGRIKDHKEKVYDIRFQDGSMVARLLEVNGRPPAEADLKKQAENEMTVRQLLGESRPVKAENRDDFLSPELVARFDFKLLGQSSINGRQAYALAFHPKSPPLPVHRLVDRLLNRISGTLWIDASEYEVARAQMELRSTVDILGGVAGVLRKLDFTMTRTRVADGLWLKTYSRGDFEGRKLLESMHVRTSSQTTSFRKISELGRAAQKIPHALSQVQGLRAHVTDPPAG